MKKILFDSHSHISDEAYSEDHDNFIESLLSSELEICMDIGTSVRTSLDCIESARLYDFCYATVGVHPSEIEGLTQEALEHCLSAFDENPKVVAVGEIGLDYHYDDGPPREDQIYWFGKQIDWAVEHAAPICVHSRDADEDCMRVLREHGAFSEKRRSSFPKKANGDADCRVLLHCFSGSAELAKQYLRLGATISLAGPVTFKNARKAVEVAGIVPLSDLLIETDSPYMAPEPKRGTRNTPANVMYVAKKIAELKGLSYEEVAAVTAENAKRFYGIK